MTHFETSSYKAAKAAFLAASNAINEKGAQHETAIALFPTVKKQFLVWIRTQDGNTQERVYACNAQEAIKQAYRQRLVPISYLTPELVEG